ncbi:hypothetical protein [Candidatus Entotheonella palauensis]|uniref:hypothetical protein n=1 Tax=Candidatus Entotheonella palauensis TaxID=93172 RepID=UPI000B7EACFD|nr:hypothetical protein [Candidatus Entotheonella palauensis]
MRRLGLQTGGRSSQVRLWVDRVSYGLIPMIVLVCALFFYVSHVADAEGDIPPVAEAFPPGLDERPVSATCVAPERPQQGISTRTVIAFPNLSFDEPSDLVQAPQDDDTWYIAERKGLIRSGSLRRFLRI